MDIRKIVIFLLPLSLVYGACPDRCQCETSSLGTTVFCTPDSQQQLQVQIRNLPKETVHLHIGDHGNLNCNLGKQLLDKSFVNLPKEVTNLYIENCDIENVGQLAFTGLTNLQNLYIKDNPIQTLPNSLLKSLNSLIGFFLQNCPLTELPGKVFSETPCFRQLEISGTHLTNLNVAFEPLTCVNNLNISHNKLAKIETKMFTNMKMLLDLDVSYNKNVQFEELVFNELKKLTALMMAGITDNANLLPQNMLSGLDQLIEISIDDNGFKTMSQIELFLKDVLGIKYISANGNNLTELTGEETSHLTEIETLQVSRNNIKILEKEAFRGASKLTHLKLDDNKITAVPGGMFSHAKAIVELDLSNNGLTTITPTSFKYLTKLDRLNLHGSNISIINKDLFPSDLAALKTLDLSGSSIQTISPNALDQLKGLLKLNLNENDLKSVPKETLKMLALRGVDVDISENDWKCDCEMFLYRQWMEENQMNYSMICAEPPVMKGEDVMKLPGKESFGCKEPSVKECCTFNLTVTEGSQAAFTCTVEAGDPTPSLYIAIINGDPLPENKTEISADNSTIVVSNVTVENDGNFTCTATNVWGSVTTNYQLIVEAPMTTPEPNTTFIPPMTYAPGSTPLPTALPYIIPGAILGVIIILVLFALAVGCFLVAWYVKKRRNADDRNVLVSNEHTAVQA